jgi:hypothetical protein
MYHVASKVWAFCDNESVCNTFNGLLLPAGEYEGCDPDVWGSILAVKRILGTRFVLTWQRRDSHQNLKSKI